MKQGGHNKKHSGFTIVETLIVLAVSGGLFLVAATYIGGKQAKTEFQLGVRDVQTRMQQAINEAASGYYPNNTKFNCSAAGPANSNLDLDTNGSPPSQGTNQDCIFIGKVLVVDKNTLYVYSLAGATKFNGQDVKNPKEARATVIDESAANSSHAPKLTDVVKLPSGFTLSGASSNNATIDTSVRTYGVAILSSLADFSESAGSQHFKLSAISGTFTPPTSQLSIANIINNEFTTTSPYEELAQVRYCIENDTGRSALIIIGGEGSLAVRTEIKSGATCGA